MVDDHETFRQFICSTLGKKSGLRVVGQVSDGVEAVRKAEELQPDLILMDIGLPSLSGIEAARRIRKLAPTSKVLFLSQESSADVMQEALGLGAQGYVVKTHAGLELLTTVEAVCLGKQYVSGGLSGLNFTEVKSGQAPYHQSHRESLTSLPPGTAEITRCHEVQFCSDDTSFLLGFSRFVETALEAGNAVIVVATESHRKSLLQRLQARGCGCFHLL